MQQASVSKQAAEQSPWEEEQQLAAASRARSGAEKLSEEGISLAQAVAPGGLIMIAGLAMVVASYCSACPPVARILHAFACPGSGIGGSGGGSASSASRGIVKKTEMRRERVATNDDDEVEI